jgi:carbon storage regulator
MVEGRMFSGVACGARFDSSTGTIPVAGIAVRLVSNVVSEAAFNDRDWFSAHRVLQAPLPIWFESKTIAGYEFNGFYKTWSVEMLILSRKAMEKIRVNDDITIVVLEIRENSVRLGFEAGKDVKINRQEVYEAIQLKRGAM